MALNSPFEDLITEAEIQQLRALYAEKVKPHPLVSVALDPEFGQYPDQIATNTCRALHHVLRKFPKWAQNLRTRLLDQTDWTNAGSALAEIRACGALIEARFPIALGAKNLDTGAQAEFHIVLDNIETIIEVWSRNLSEKERASVDSQLKKSSRTRVIEGQALTSAEAAIAPFGAPDPKKKGDSFLTNAISRIAQIKDKEHQVHADKPFVVWVDLQSHEGLLFDYSSQLQPLMCWHGALSSGGYWHGLYGRKGDLILEGGGGMTRMNVMQHDGRFFQVMKHGERTRVSAFIFSSPKTTALMENLEPTHSVPASFRKCALNFPWFEMNLSIVNWSDGLANKIVCVQREYIGSVIAAMGFKGPRELR
jgi:hypothetical protein